MVQDDIKQGDALRIPDTVMLPDPRTKGFVVVSNGLVREVSQSDQFDAIECYQLNDTVPIGVRVHFETAKNLYLYAWFVYRFYAVAEQHVLTSLEYGLRERLMQGHVSKSRADRMGLSDLLKRARNHGLINNNALPGRIRWATEVAQKRQSANLLLHMIETGITEMAFDESQVEATPDDLAIDWIGRFIEHLPDIRNNYAHGSETLHHTVLRTFEIVSDLVNQLFPKPT